MPKQEQTIPVSNLKKEDVLIVAFSTFQKLDWEVKFAGEEKLLGHTARSWRSYGEEIVITAADNFLTVSSELKGNVMFDMSGRNKKRIASFIAAFETEKSVVTADSLEKDRAAVQGLQSETRVVAEKEIQNAKEVDAVMNLSKSNLYVTYSIIAINVIVFVIMCIKGVPVMDPTGLDVIKWGGNYGPLTLTGDWWRLITCVFVHIGIIHIAFNMYALYMVGVFLEPMLGKLRYTVAYLSTGILSSVVSLWWHSTPVPSAGASGAIFGMFGVFLALLLTNLIPKQVRNGLLQSIGILVGYNLLYGMKSGVDNSAHVGGLISGLVIGFIYYFTLKSAANIKRVVATSLAIAVASVLICNRYIYYKKADLPANARMSIETEIQSAGFPDKEKFNEQYDQFVNLQDSALSIYHKTDITNEVLKDSINNTSLPLWNKAEAISDQMLTLNISAAMHVKAQNVKQFIEFQKDKIAILNDMIEDNSPANKKRLDDLEEKINVVVKTLQ